jgi:hypothetical protein
MLRIGNQAICRLRNVGRFVASTIFDSASSESWLCPRRRLRWCLRAAGGALDGFATSQRLDEPFTMHNRTEADLAQARSRYPEAKAGATTEELAIADAKVALVLAAVDVLEAHPAKARMLVPVDGTHSRTRQNSVGLRRTRRVHSRTQCSTFGNRPLSYRDRRRLGGNSHDWRDPALGHAGRRKRCPNRSTERPSPVRNFR